MAGNRSESNNLQAGRPGVNMPVAPFSTRAAAHVREEGAGHAPSLVEQVGKVPTDPGCYLWKDAEGGVIYVGKAKNLRARLRQYVTLTDNRAKIPLMMQLVASFDYIVVGTEHEALVLERELIAQYHPYFNVDYKDDKSYPYIAITKGDVFPAIKYTREKHRPDTRYFGPYTDSRAARETIDTLRKVCPVCTASCAEWKRVRRLLEKRPDEADIIELICASQGRPCFDYHVWARSRRVRGHDRTRGIRQERQARGALSLGAAARELVDELKSDMAAAAADLDFERAGRIKRRLSVIDGLDDRQQVVFPTSVDLDLVGFYREGDHRRRLRVRGPRGPRAAHLRVHLGQGLRCGRGRARVGLCQALLRRDRGYSRGGERGRRYPPTPR